MRPMTTIGKLWLFIVWVYGIVAPYGLMEAVDSGSSSVPASDVAIGAVVFFAAALLFGKSINKTVLALSSGVAIGSIGAVVVSFSTENSKGFVAAWVLWIVVGLFVAGGSRGREERRRQVLQAEFAAMRREIMADKSFGILPHLPQENPAPPPPVNRTPPPPKQPVLQPPRSNSSPLAPTKAAASWEPDPTGRFELRYWDGSQWTDHVTSGGVPATDPV